MNVALLLAGGTGSRLGADMPKQYIEVAGKPVISYSMETLLNHNEIDAIQIVASKKWHKQIEKWLSENDLSNKTGKKFRGFSKTGENRQLSILNGLEDIKEYAEMTDYVLIHDAARPMISGELITRCLNEVKEYDGVIPVLPMTDTVYYSTDGKKVSSLLNRNEIFAGQAPEVFVLGKYLQANRDLLPDDIFDINGSTEVAVMAGMNIAMIAGDERNYKITTAEDMARFENEKSLRNRG
jgi:2-C-methyl-D-erythritol 4-phosphate cytidylyltransferase